MKQFIVAVMAALTLIACSSESATQSADTSKSKRRLHPGVYAPSVAEYVPLNDVSFRFVDTLAQNGDVVWLGTDSFIVCDSTCISCD